MTTETTPAVDLSKLEFHPFANIFPLMEGEEFERFKEDIKAKKQQEPIILYQGMILDGRNRYLACKELRLTPIVKEYDGRDPLGFVLSANLHRRHLNESQRAMVAAKLVTLKPGANQYTKQVPSIEDTSKLLNVGKASIERARKVINDGAPELVKAVEQNKVRVSAAAKVAEKPREEQSELVNKGAKAVRAAAKAGKTPEKIEALINKLVKALKGVKKQNVENAAADVATLIQRLKDADLYVEERGKKKAA